MFRLIRLPLVLFAALWCMALPLATLAQATQHTLTHDGLERTYHLFRPAGHTPTEAVPLLVALHPVASSGLAMAALTDLHEMAGDYLVAYPESHSYYWDDGRVAAGLPPVLETVDDVGFISAMIDEISADYAISAVYLTGFGNGGVMAYRMACEMPQRFDGVAVVGALLWDYLEQTCPEAAAPLNLLMMRGTDDINYPAGGRLYTEITPDGDDRMIAGIDATLNYWAQRSGCADATPEALNDTILRYAACADDTQVAFYSIVSAGHNWPRRGDYRLNRFDVDASQVILDFFNQDDAWTEQRINETPGLPRSYLAYVPTSYTPDTPLPLVIVLHGRPDNGWGIAYITDMNTVAEREGFIAVYPDGIGRQWNYVLDIPGYQDIGINDAAFLTDFIHDLSLDLSIDPQRIYVTGFSNGGFMTQRLACEIPAQFAAFAVVGATGFFGMTPLCEGQPPVPMLLMHGTADVSIPWRGETMMVNGQRVYNTAPVQDTLAFWAAHNGCDFDFNQQDLPPGGDSPGTQVRLVTFDGCANGSDLTFYAILGGGHNWPGVPGRISQRIAGDVNMDINASEVIWDFFQQYTRQAE